MTFGRTAPRSVPAIVLSLALAGCSGSPSGSTVLTADMPLHLEEHLDVATIVSSAVPADAATTMEWRFDQPQEDWKPVIPRDLTVDPVEVTQLDDALRVTLTDGTRWPNFPAGALVLEVPDWNYEDMAHLVVRARTTDAFQDLGIYFNRRDGTGPMFEYAGELVFVVTDGTVRTYQMRLDLFRGRQPLEEPIRQIALWFNATDVASIDILSVSIVPAEAKYADAPAGVGTEAQDEAHRRTLYAHSPSRIAYRVRVPEAGRLDLGLGVLRGDAPVRFRITAEPGGGEAETLLEETHADQERWAQRSIDLSHLAGRTITLALEADAERAGTVALWAAPTLTGVRASEKPNVIFYIIDAGGADYMSVYGYNRRTTPNLERLAAEGAVFEHAYSNSGATPTSVPSFMTSLHTSVMGGYTGNDDVTQDVMVPEEEVTMAHHLHRAGFQTAVFTTNTYAGGTGSGLGRSVDVMREAGVEPQTASSRELNEDYWSWRETYPGEPYWVHFQTTELVRHVQHEPAAPFAGLFASPELRETYYEWDRQLAAASGISPSDWRRGPYSTSFEETGISRVAYYDARRGLYDENLASNDYQLGQLVERLKAEGEWERTLFIVASDHGSHSQQALGVSDSLPPYPFPLFRSSVTRVPLLIVWPSRIAGGQRFSQPVSLIDVLPTILDLADLPMPEVMQGQSLAPLLLGEDGWEPRPVILDDFRAHQTTGELSGVIEVIDGRWGASLDVNRSSYRESPGAPRLLLYDLWKDPMALNLLNEERPDLVEKYTSFLEAQFEAHQSLAQLFTPSSDQVALTPEQLRTLRALGYIQ